MHTLFYDWDAAAPVPRTENTLTQAERDALVRDNIGLARNIAIAIAEMDPHADRDDLFGEACLAFVESSKYYDPTNARGTPFSGYASGYARRRLLNRVCRGMAGHGKTIVRGLEMDAMPASGPTGRPVPETRGPDAFDRELLAALLPEAREIVTCAIYEGVTVPRLAVRFNRAEKDIRLILTNAAKRLEARKRELDAPDLMDFIQSAESGGLT